MPGPCDRLPENDEKLFFSPYFSSHFAGFLCFFSDWEEKAKGIILEELQRKRACCDHS
jgi:hypothetical protein